MNLTLNALNHLSTTILGAVLNSVAPTLAAALILWLALRFMPRVNAATRHAVWWAALATVVIMPFMLLPRSAHDSLPAVAAQRQVPARADAAATPPSDARPSSASEVAASRFVTTDSPRTPSSYQRLASAFHPIELRAGRWPGWFFALWFAACLFLFGRLIHSYLHLRNLRLNSRPATGELLARFEGQLAGTSIVRRPMLLVSDEIASPLAAGFFRPMVVLPERLLQQIDEPELDYVLLHELAHVARRDDWTNLLARVATALFAFHPVALWILKRIEREREIACDDWVVAKTGSARRYAATLARLFEVCRTRRHELLATGMARRSSHLGERIEMLLKPRFADSGADLHCRIGGPADRGNAHARVGKLCPGTHRRPRAAGGAERGSGASAACSACFCRGNSRRATCGCSTDHTDRSSGSGCSRRSGCSRCPGYPRSSGRSGGCIGCFRRPDFHGRSQPGMDG